MANGAKKDPQRRAHREFRTKLPGVSYGVLDDLLGYQIRRAQLRLYEDFDRILAPDGITPQRFAALVLIGGNPGVGQIRLSEIMGIARTGAKAIVDNLVDRGWVDRTPDPSDLRQRGLRLTDAGVLALTTLREQVGAHDQQMAAVLTQEERETLIFLLNRLAAP